MKEGDLVQTPRGFVEDDGGEAKKECHFRSHDTTGPADHFALFLFSARRPDPLSTPLSSLSPSFRLTRGVANRSRTRETDGRPLLDFRSSKDIFIRILVQKNRFIIICLIVR